jgi:hypothetical protein
VSGTSEKATWTKPSKNAYKESRYALWIRLVNSDWIDCVDTVKVSQPPFAFGPRGEEKKLKTYIVPVDLGRRFGREGLVGSVI